MNNEKTPAQGERAAEIERGPIVVNNRDIPLLADVLCIMQGVCALEERRDWQRDRMTNITQHLTGMPGGGGLPKGIDEAFVLLSEIEEEHKEQCKEYVRLLKKAQKILNGIESRSMRTFVVMKYVMDVPDIQIRRELNMTWRGFDRARRAVEGAKSMAAVKWQERYIIAQKEDS